MQRDAYCNENKLIAYQAALDIYVGTEMWELVTKDQIPIENVDGVEGLSTAYAMSMAHRFDDFFNKYLEE
jgi:hypothetical protein